MQEEKYIFEIYKNEKRLFYTYDKKCRYSNEIINNMKKAGYVIKENGKKIK